MKQEKKWVFYIGLAMVAAFWGMNFGVSRKGMETFDPVLFSFLRFAIAIPFFFLILKLKEGRIGLPLNMVPRFMLLGFFGVTVLEIMVLYSIKYTTLANASLLNVAPWPIFAALFGPFFLRERITSRLVTGGIASMVGVCFIILGGGAGLDMSSDNMLGNLLAFVVSIMGSLYNLACMPLMKRFSPLYVSTWYTAFGVLFMFPFTLPSWGKVDWLALGTDEYTAVLFNVFVCTVIGFIVWNASMLRIGATRANFFRYLVPAFAAGAGYLFFDEAFSGWQLAGTVCMAAGLVWISLERPEPTPVSA